jgi:DNA repair exonuclease SbcCD ATPase subunit
MATGRQSSSRLMAEKLKQIEAKLKKIEEEIRSRPIELAIGIYEAQVAELEKKLAEVESTIADYVKYEPGKPKALEKEWSAAEKAFSKLTAQREALEKKLDGTEAPKARRKLEAKLKTLKGKIFQLEDRRKFLEKRREVAELQKATSLDYLREKREELRMERDRYVHKIKELRGEVPTITGEGKRCVICGAFFGGEQCGECGAKVIGQELELAAARARVSKIAVITRYSILFVLIGIIMFIIGFFFL